MGMGLSSQHPSLNPSLAPSKPLTAASKNVRIQRSGSTFFGTSSKLRSTNPFGIMHFAPRRLTIDPLTNKFPNLPKNNNPDFELRRQSSIGTIPVSGLKIGKQRNRSRLI